MRKIEAVLFDLDGTLVDSFRDIAQSVNYVLVKLGKPEKSLDEVRLHVGHGIRNMLKGAVELASEEEIDRAIETFRGHYWDHCLDYSALYPGVGECLQKLDGYKKAVATNKNRIFAEKMVSGLGIRDHFDAVLGGDDYPALKPDPSAVLEVCRRIEVDASLCLMIGDSSPDIESAVGAGALACGVAYGIGSRSEILRYGASRIFESMTEIPEYIEEINRRK